MTIYENLIIYKILFLHYVISNKYLQFSIVCHHLTFGKHLMNILAAQLR